MQIVVAGLAEGFPMGPQHSRLIEGMALLGRQGHDVVHAGGCVQFLAQRLIVCAAREPLGNGQPSSCRIRTAPDFSMHSVDGLNSH